ncbi:hypothetical protein AB0I68_02870 [Streptomyces sp. NPDC050448]|uniref:hypothetical protein n=1 Tax=Streptomyces sp. NPDC050448 TaxID=3155404 RepID=UPI0034402725
MTDMYDIWRRAEAAWEVDALAGHLAARHSDPQVRRELAEAAAAGRAAVAAGDLGAARRQRSFLRGRAEPGAGEPPCPWEPRPAERDALVWDYAKDLLRAELPPGELNLHDVGWVRFRLEGISRRFGARLEAGTGAREDLHYLAGRAAMALELGDLAAAEREMARIRELEQAYADAEDG